MYGLGFENTSPEPDYASMDPYEALLAYGAAHPGDFGTPSMYVDPGIVPSGGGVSAWLKKNSTAVYAGAGILVLMAMFGGKRR